MLTFATPTVPGTLYATEIELENESDTNWLLITTAQHLQFALLNVEKIICQFELKYAFAAYSELDWFSFSLTSHLCSEYVHVKRNR